MDTYIKVSPEIVVVLAEPMDHTSWADIFSSQSIITPLGQPTTPVVVVTV
jgi:hypothetical protein